MEKAEAGFGPMLAGRDEGVERNKKRMNEGGVQCGVVVRLLLIMLAWL